MNYPYFGGMPNYQMPVSGAKYGGMGQNAMVAPNSYGGDPYFVGGGGGMGYGGSPAGYLGPSAPMTPEVLQQYNFARSSEGMAPLPGASPQSIAGFQANMSPRRNINPGMNSYQGAMGQQPPLMRNRGMRPYRGQNALNSMYGQMPSPYASLE